MSKLAQFSKVSASAILALNLAFLQSQGVQAAEFNFYFGGGGGYLSFDASPLTGRGTESISLSTLKSYAQNQSSTLPTFSYNYTTYNPIASSIDGQGYISLGGDDGIFKFQEGSLIGIESSGGTAYLSDVGNQYNNPYYSSTTSGSFSLSLLGDHYETSLNITNTTYTTTIEPDYDQDGNLLGYRENTTIDSHSSSYDPYESGSIDFLTITPVTQAVPEPLTMLGVGTAFGFGSFFKRELKKKQKSEPS